MSDDPVEFLEIQEKLRLDTDGALRRTLEGQLAGFQQQVKRRLDSGATPDEFKKLTALSEAATAAGQVLVTCWTRHHKG